MPQHKYSTEKYFDFFRWNILNRFNPFITEKELERWRSLNDTIAHYDNEKHAWVFDVANELYVPSCVLKLRPGGLNMLGTDEQRDFSRYSEKINSDFIKTVREQPGKFETIAYLTDDNSTHELAIIELGSNKAMFAKKKNINPVQLHREKRDIIRKRIKENNQIFPNGEVGAGGKIKVYLMPLRDFAECFEEITGVKSDVFVSSEPNDNTELAGLSTNILNSFKAALFGEKERTKPEKKPRNIQRENELSDRYKWMAPEALSALIEADYQYTHTDAKSEDYAGVLVLYAKAIELQLKSVVSVDDLRIKDTPTLSTLFDKYVKTYPWYDAKYVDFAKRHLIPYRNKGAHSEKISRETMSAIRRYLYDGGFLNSFNR